MQKSSLVIEKGERERFMQEILDREWEMFQAVKSATPASCQESPETFRKVRGSIFQLWPRKLMAAYLIELTAAKRHGRNLLTEKYARMDNLIPPINTNPVIDKIVAIEAQWQQAIRERYPALYARSCRGTDRTDDGNNFSVYLRSELETYGDTALDIYYEWVEMARRSGMNYSLSMLNHLVLNSGFESIEAAEAFWSKEIDT
ncbi:DUF4125 family protein [Desulfosarcina ovata]|uniref:DUF4125 domain-containing protein n=2 Tax=Desulfosarcina ovata TaxID=83564 RepID=A0A5K8AL15_9BACT|nr:DUF4125 family protein [Desulfosarcina ovata]BBO86571.1 hypothetical protein DSCO28_71370 [Desulfosarcina ovata subsp. sediminis]BBO93427.1 hypothetical protein DSCOOX_66070 [Desulfosarcina ovata subsp. ovata]